MHAKRAVAFLQVGVMVFARSASIILLSVFYNMVQYNFKVFFKLFIILLIFVSIFFNHFNILILKIKNIKNIILN